MTFSVYQSPLSCFACAIKLQVIIGGITTLYFLLQRDTIVIVSFQQKRGMNPNKSLIQQPKNSLPKCEGINGSLSLLYIEDFLFVNVYLMCQSLEWKLKKHKSVCIHPRTKMVLQLLMSLDKQLLSMAFHSVYFSGPDFGCEQTSSSFFWAFFQTPGTLNAFPGLKSIVLSFTRITHYKANPFWRYSVKISMEACCFSGTILSMQSHNKRFGRVHILCSTQRTLSSPLQ